MLIALFVFACIFGATFFILKHSFSERLSDKLNSVSKTYQTDGKILQHDCLLISAVSIGDYTVINGEDIYSYDAILKITENGLRFAYGKIGDVCFKTFNISNGKLIVAIDCSELILSHKTLQTNVLFILAVCYLLFGLIICAFSVKVFRPMQESLFRQKEFLSNAGHELKTPITVISASTDVLLKEGDNKYLKNIKTQSKRLEFLVEDMLTLAQIDEEKFAVNKERVSVSNLILECALPFEETAFISGKNFVIDVEENLYKNIDANSLKTVVNVLLDNAFKYSNDNGSIKISLKKIGNNLNFCVFNTGSLIPSELENKIFERFYRGEDSRNRDYGGNGLGLSIAKNICSINNWKISAKSVYGVSMTLTLEIK